MGKGDKKTKRGKIVNRSYGVRRPKKVKKNTYQPTAKPVVEEAEEKTVKKKTTAKKAATKTAAKKTTATKKTTTKKTTAKKTTTKKEKTEKE